ncbi:MAG: hypothetical protein HN348_07675 [Proteobacteria bacterium]|nr:hypothetical protein [Pseudomonadota bacterium]
MKRRSDWNFYSYSYGEGQEATVHFDLQAALFTPETHAWCVRVVVENQTGSFETTLMDELADVDGLLVGILEYSQQQEFVLQLEDKAQFTPHEGTLVELGASLEQIDGWGYFDDRVCPTEFDWRRITDREAIECLVRDGLDPTEPIELEHYFVGDAATLEEIRHQLDPLGFIEVAVDDSRLALKYKQPLSEVSDVTPSLLNMCRKMGIVYDGWAQIR